MGPHIHPHSDPLPCTWYSKWAETFILIRIHYHVLGTVNGPKHSSSSGSTYMYSTWYSRLAQTFILIRICWENRKYDDVTYSADGEPGRKWRHRVGCGGGHKQDVTSHSQLMEPRGGRTMGYTRWRFLQTLSRVFLHKKFKIFLFKFFSHILENNKFFMFWNQNV